MPKRESEAARRAREAKKSQQTDPANVTARYIRRDANGAISVAFPKHFGALSKGPVELEGLEAFTHLAEPIAEAYTLRFLESQSADARYRGWGTLKTGFVKFLAGHGAGHAMQLGEIDEATLVAFKSWIDDPASPIYMPSVNSRSPVLQAGQRILSTLMASKRWAPLLSPNLKLLKNPYPNAGKSTKHTEILDDATLERLYVHAANDCERSIRRFRRDRKALAVAIARRVPLEEAGRDAFSCAAYLLQTYEGVIPVYWKLVNRSKRFAPNVRKPVFTAAKRLLYPDLDEILPFVLLLTLMFAFTRGSCST